MSDDEIDKWEAYAERFESARPNRNAPRKDGQSAKRAKAQSIRKIEELSEKSGLEAGFVTTYHPARFEAEWLLSSLRSFYEQELITDVLASVKGGKEASVYRCAGHETTGQTFLAAKVYRPR
jgi:hypothetical protein